MAQSFCGLKYWSREELEESYKRHARKITKLNLKIKQLKEYNFILKGRLVIINSIKPKMIEWTELQNPTTWAKKGGKMPIEISVKCDECGRLIQLDDVVYCYECVEKVKRNNNRDFIFISHIQSHLKKGDEVICKICGKTAQEIIKG